ncbi:DUF397 domain-containing protein [Streptomyces sp. NPDC049879]|uniref:DUF397 domain-containing protein n=1 Tax=Streptomyces sp. NPDC049879 TaxID=3365598 RepID=UPI0037A2AFD2
MMSPEKEELHDAPLGGEWFKSSFSNGNMDNCVELMAIVGGVAVQDSKSPGLTPQRYTHAEFTAFITAVKAGALDHPAT